MRAKVLCFTLHSATNRQKTAADEWIKKVICGDTMSKSTGLLEEQVPRTTARAHHAHAETIPRYISPRSRSSASVC